MRQLTLLALATALVPVVARAQRVESPASNALYLALGGDYVSDIHGRSPLFVSAGVERSRAGSRWSFRLGADYRRQSTPFLETRWEDFGLGLTARYARRSGMIRPYVLGGVGIADLRVRGRWARYEELMGSFLGPDSSVTSVSRWNGAITSGFGTEVSFGRLRLFGEGRVNLYPAALSDAPRSHQLKSTKGLFIGVKL